MADKTVEQDEVDAAFDRLANVMWMLDFIKGDKTSLQSLVDRIDKLNAANYNAATWNAMLPVLEKANVVIADENAMQEEVNEIYTELIKTFLNLRLKPDKNALNDLINQAKALNAPDYTIKSFAMVTNALQEAELVLMSEDATALEVKTAAETLSKAIDNLIKIENNVNVSTINKNVNDSKESVKTGDTTSFISTGLLAELSMVVYVALRKREN